MPSPLGLNDSFTEEGLWWVEGREDEKVGGTLAYDPENGPVLTVLGTLRDLITSMNSALGTRTSSNETIFGFTSGGKRVTLLNSINSSRRLNLPGVPSEVWKSNIAVIGEHIADEDEEIFLKSFLAFASIEEWLDHSPFSVAHNSGESSITLNARRSKEAHFASHNDFKITTVGRLHSTNTPSTRYAIESTIQIGIEPNSPRSLKWHFDAARKIQELASLCTGHYLPITALNLKGSDEDYGGGEMHPSDVHVFARLIHPQANARPRNDSPVLTGPELVALNPDALQLWFDQYETLDPAIALFFTITAQREMFTNIRLILAIQALEVLHRRTSADRIISDEEFTGFREKMLSLIPESCTKDMRNKLEGTYAFLNEPSLSQRLRSIVASVKEDFGFAPSGFTKSYLRKLVATRNYYTHFSKELEDVKLDGAGMYWASRRIVLLITILLLRRLQIPADELNALLARHNEFSQLWSSDADPS